LNPENPLQGTKDMVYSFDSIDIEFDSTPAPPSAWAACSACTEEQAASGGQIA